MKINEIEQAIENGQDPYSWEDFFQEVNVDRDANREEKYIYSTITFEYIPSGKLYDVEIQTTTQGSVDVGQIWIGEHVEVEALVKYYISNETEILVNDTYHDENYYYGEYHKLESKSLNNSQILLFETKDDAQEVMNEYDVVDLYDEDFNLAIKEIKF